MKNDINDMGKDDIAVIMCPPISKYKQPDDDISACTLEDCPLCGNKMWFSIKKKVMKEFCEEINKNIFFGCYDCVEKFIINESKKGSINELVQVNI